MENKIILMDSPEAATETTITAWKSASGHIYTNEHVARYEGCTHRKCEYCGEPCLKRWSACESCRAKRKKEAFMALPVVEWDEKTPLCIYGSDQYLCNYNEILDYCEENELRPLELMLVLCEPMELRTLDYDFFEDCLADEQELPEEIKKAIDEFNAKIVAYSLVISWVPAKKRIKL